jgi:hypothetical protein
MSTSVLQEDRLSKKDLYEQGSKCCQQYSTLTMQIRTLAQYIIIAYTVGVSLTLTRGESLHEYISYILIGAGIVVSLFAAVLGLLNKHYSTAFREIRNRCLIPLEDSIDENWIKEGIHGPWQAHKLIRDKQSAFVY